MTALYKIFAIGFYKRYVNLFLIVLVFTAGFMRSQDHIALAEYFVSSPVLLAIPFVTWLLYLYFIIDFNRNSCHLREHEFLYHFRLFTIIAQWKGLTSAVTIQLAPCWFYGLFLILVAFRNGDLTTVLLILSVLSGLTLVLLETTRRLIVYSTHQRTISSIRSWFDRHMIKGVVHVQIEWALRLQPLPLAAFKLISVVLLYATLHLYTTDDYDMRLLLIGVVFAFGLNLHFVQSIHVFQNRHFSIMRQLPFTDLQRYGYLLYPILLFTLPEFFIILRNLPANLSYSDAFAGYGLGVSINLVLFSILFVQLRRFDHFMIIYYFIMVGSFMMVLSAVPAWVLAMTFLCLSIVLFKRNFHRFEYLSD